MISKVIIQFKINFFSFIVFFLKFSSYFLTRNNVKIWSRNSMRLPYFSRYSDLDLTFLVKKNKCLPLAKTLASSYLKFNVGEVNFFLENDLSWAYLCNSFEIERDPSLKSLVSCNHTYSQAEAQAFFLRMLESDTRLKNEKLAPSRQRKWDFHFACIEKKLNIRFPKSCTIWKKENLQEAFSLLFSNISGISFDDFYSNLDHDKLFYTMPHRWIGVAIANNYPIQYEVPKSQLEESLISLQVEQIKWEMWGLLSQLLLDSIDRSIAMRHFDNLFKLLSAQKYKELRADDYLAYINNRYSF